jgi:RNA polymerase sigma-70 factor (ECF subfamily)
VNSADTPLNPEELLKHTRWMVPLARTLVRHDQAEDLVQDAWLALVKNPPRTEHATRSWLRSVLTRIANRRHREKYARDQHERAVARSEESRQQPDEIVERAQSHRLLVDMVLKLNEPYRTTVLLRYFGGLTTKDIAERQAVAVPTVRSRLNRAMELLRSDLDRQHRGDRQAWISALLPLAAAPSVPGMVAAESVGAESLRIASAVEAARTVATSVGGLLVMKKAVILAVCAVVVVLSFWAYRVERRDVHRLRIRRELSRSPLSACRPKPPKSGKFRRSCGPFPPFETGGGGQVPFERKWTAECACAAGVSGLRLYEGRDFSSVALRSLGRREV